MIPCPTPTWPAGSIRFARKSHGCDYVNHTPGSGRCCSAILPQDWYFDPGENNPSEASGFGNYRYCLGEGHPGVSTVDDASKALGRDIHDARKAVEGQPQPKPGDKP